MNEESLLVLSRYTENTPSGKADKQKQKNKQFAESLRTSLMSLYYSPSSTTLPPGSGPTPLSQVTKNNSKGKTFDILEAAKRSGAHGFLTEIGGGSDHSPTTSTSSPQRANDRDRQPRPTSALLSEPDGDETLFRVSVMTSDGFSMGYLLAETVGAQGAIKLSLTNSTDTNKVLFQVCRKVDGWPERTIALQSVSARAYVSSKDRKVDAADGPSACNCIDTSSSKWRIYCDENFTLSQPFGLGASNEVNIGPTKEPLMFTLQQYGGAMGMLFREKLDELIVQPAGPPPSKFARRRFLRT